MPTKAKFSTYRLNQRQENESKSNKQERDVAENNYNEKMVIMQLKDETLRNAAFSLIVRQYSQRIYWHIRHMVLSHEDADDIVQETFIKAWTTLIP